jgi:membrane protease YdiL (CAAX protease family)
MYIRNIVSDKPPLLSLLLIIVNVFLGSLIGSMIGIGVAGLFYEGDLSTAIQNTEIDPTLTSSLLIIQSIGTFVGMILFPLTQLLAIEHKKISPFFPEQPQTGFILLLVSILGLTFMLSISPLTVWNMHWEFPEFLRGFQTWAREKEDLSAKLTEAMTNFNSLSEVLVGVLVIALLPAIGEELVFRGLIQNEFFRGSGKIHLSIWASAFVFSAIHLQFFGFIPRLLLGALFGYLYYWSGNLLVPIFAHFFNNAFSVIMIYLYAKKIIDIDPQDNSYLPVQYVLINLVITVALLYYIRKHFQQLPKPVSDSLEY